MNEEKEFSGIVEKTEWDHNYGDYHLEVKIKEEIYKLTFRHRRTYVVDDGDLIKFKGFIDEQTKEIKVFSELWVKLV